LIPPLLAILIWPVVAGILFATLSLRVAILGTILGGYLVLPPAVGLNLPMLPTLTKETLPVLAAVLFATIAVARSGQNQAYRPGWFPASWPARGILVIAVAAPFLTALTNRDVLVRGYGVVQPAISLYDSFSTLLTFSMALLPLLVARRFFASTESHRLLLVALATAGLVWSLPTLFEVRMSPLLNYWIYGFFPHSWIQHVRGGGFRPLVFMTHGLVLSIFMAICFLATLALARRASRENQMVWWAASVWLLVTLFLTKSLGAIMIAVALAPVVIFLNRRLQFLAAAVIAGVILAYPLMRGGPVPLVPAVMSVAEAIDPERASSFAFRLREEEEILDRAMERPLFGWGGYARGRVYDEFGNYTSVTDGYWIIIFGDGGWARYIGIFGLLCVPVVMSAMRARRYDLAPETAAVALILAANLVDLIPNTGISPVTWLLAGALWGRLELGLETKTADATSQQRTARSPHRLARAGQPSYTRFRTEPGRPGNT
jgi:hypothetical protein